MSAELLEKVAANPIPHQVSSSDSKPSLYESRLEGLLFPHAFRVQGDVNLIHRSPERF